MQKRIEQCQKLMKVDGLDAVIVRMSENVVLYSGYWPLNGFSFVFIPQIGEATVICPEGDIKEASMGTIKRIEPFGWVKLACGNPYDNVLTILKRLREEFDIQEGASIGVDIGADSASVPLCSGEIGLPGLATQAIIQEAFDTYNLCPIGDMIDTLRSCKEPEDIIKIDIANKITREGVKYFENIINRPNMREIDVAAEVESYIARFACGFEGAKYAKAWAQVCSGPKTAGGWAAGLTSGDRVLEREDFVLLEIGVAVDGYWCDLTQTACVGRMNGQKAEMYSSVLQAQTDAIMAVKEGVRASEIDKIARDSICRAGFGKYFVHHTGHGLGFAYHERYPTVNPSSEDVLKAGMIHSVEPGIYIPDVGGCRVEANVLVEKDGCRILGQ